MARLQCRCGGVAGQLETGNGTLIECHCPDCAAYRAHLHPGQTHAPGVQIYQTTPDQITIEQGWDELACLRLSAKGMHRWYAACCNTPLANCLVSPVMPFVGIPTEAIAQEDRASLGRVRCISGRTKPGGGSDNRNLGAMVWGILKRGLTARLSGTERHAPFFAPDGQPVKAPRVLDAN